MTLESRFWKKVDKENGPIHPLHGKCWEWRGGLFDNGYGRFWGQGARALAHRASWFVAHGEWPSLCVLHKCDNRKCVRIDHLFVGTQADNVADKIAKGRECYVYGEKHPLAKLTTDDVISMRRLSASGVTQRVLAAQFNISQSGVSEVISGARWAHVQ